MRDIDKRVSRIEEQLNLSDGRCGFLVVGPGEDADAAVDTYLRQPGINRASAVVFIIER